MDEDYTFQTMITCIGNKRKLVYNIYDIVDELRITLNKEELCIFDGFSGSGVVAKSLHTLCDTIITNDMEQYSYLICKCFLETPSKSQINVIKTHIEKMNIIAKNGPYIENIICKLYAPKDTNNIEEGERCFYTRKNALIIDTLREYISKNVETQLQHYCLVPLLIRASIHTNTSGVFKGFHKNGTIGCFGGKGQNALSRIMKDINLDVPIWKSKKNVHCYQENINELIKNPDFKNHNIDIIYLDPPYNQHPYGSNYFMLNLIANNVEPNEISRVSGIPSNWNKSSYNSRQSAIKDMKELLHYSLECAKYVILSYNDEGIINKVDWVTIMEPYNIKKYEIKYDTYKGSRNLKSRSNKVFEIMYVISKKL